MWYYAFHGIPVILGNHELQFLTTRNHKFMEGFDKTKFC